MTPLRTRARFLLGAALGLSLCGPAAAIFEPMGFGAPAKGMAGAYTAVANDAYAVFWNPSALAGVKRPQVAAGWEDVYGLHLLQYTNLAYAQPGVGGGTVGFSLSRLGTTGDAAFLRYSESTYALSYGRAFGDAHAGLAFKYFNVDGDLKASGMGADASLGADFFDKKASLAAVAGNLNRPSIQWETRAVDRLPREYRLAGSAQGPFQTRLSLEEDFRGSESPLFRTGISCEPGAGLTLRSGASHSSKQGAWDWALGVGLRVRRFQIDFAWNRDDSLGDSQNASLLLRF